MSFRLDFSRERTFDGIEFYQVGSDETPQRWRMYFSNKANTPVFPYGHRHPYIETGEPETRQGTVAIAVELKQPISARFIDVKILEPAVTNNEICHWRIEVILLRVVLIQLRLLKKYTIGRYLLNKL